MHCFLNVWILCWGNPWYLKCWLPLVECKSLKYQSFWDKDNPELSNFYTALTLKCLSALIFVFTSQLDINPPFSRLRHILIYFKEVVGKILLDFCVRACTSWFKSVSSCIGLHSRVLDKYTFPLKHCNYIIRKLQFHTVYTFSQPFNDNLFRKIAQDRIKHKWHRAILGEMKLANDSQSVIYSRKR